MADSRVRVPIECLICKKIFSTKWSLARHTSWLHPKREENEMGRTIIIRSAHTCKDCNVTFRQASDLRRHQRSKHTKDESEGKKRFVCILCGHGCARKDALTEHHRIHEPDSAENTFPCPECKIVFRAMKNLKRHQKLRH